MFFIRLLQNDTYPRVKISAATIEVNTITESVTKNGTNHLFGLLKYIVKTLVST